MQSHINRILDKQATAVKSPIVKNNCTANELGTQASPEKNKFSSPDGFAASSELYERLHALEDGHSGAALGSALRTELDVARSRVKELEGATKVGRREIEALLKKIADDKAASFGKEQEKVKQALQSVRDEADVERKSKRRMELANKKLTRELGEAKMALSKALQELEKERKARELMEDVCDELAREIGDDKAEVEELKRESLRIRQEVEEERRMLQMAEVWREERVHMKLAEARDEIQEKLHALEKLKLKLEEFLRARRRVMDDGDYASQQADIRDAEMLCAAADGLLLQERDNSKLSETTRRSDEIESMDDDLHSIDLTKDANSVKDRKLVEWNRMVEHRLKSDRKIYCSPESGVEIDEVSSSKSSSDEDGRIQNKKTTRRSSDNGSLEANVSGTIATGSIGSNLETGDTDTCTAASSEFDLPLQKLRSSSGSGEIVRRGVWKNSSMVNGTNRNFKSLVEWTKNGRQQAAANGKI